MTPVTEPVRRVFLPQLNRFDTRVDLDTLRKGHPADRMRMPPAPPAGPKLPIDWAKSLNFPLDGNDLYEDCTLAAAEHADNTFTGNNGRESSYNDIATVRQYLKYSPKDSGVEVGNLLLDWRGGLCGNPEAKILDAIGLDPNHAELVQRAIWLFGGIYFSLNVPDTWHHTYGEGITWDAPAIPNPKGGHAVWWDGVNAAGHYHLQTWGTSCWITPAGVALCDPAAFAVFSLRWFDKDGKAPNGLTYAELAREWEVMGGHKITPLPARPAQHDRLLAGEGLLPNESITSNNGRFTLILQNDGNFVLYGPGHQALWASNTQGRDVVAGIPALFTDGMPSDVFAAVMQPDGNVVLYNGTCNSVWATNSSGHPNATLIVQDDGNVVVYDRADQVLWSSDTVCPAVPTQASEHDRLLPCQGLVPGQSIKSADGRFTLILQTDGNLVVYGPKHQPIWSSNTYHQDHIWSAIMQTDGNFVVYDAHNKALWATGTDGNPGSSVVLQSDGNLVLYCPSHQARWASNSVVPGEPSKPTQKDRLLPGQGLLPGDFIRSGDGRFTLDLQSDGNLVLYGPGHQALWASNTNDHNNIWSASMQTDGDFVIYESNGKALWATNTNGAPGSTLILQSDGNLVLYNTGHQALWASNTVVPAEPPEAKILDRLLPGEGLMPGHMMKSAQGLFHLALQPDGNLVLYDKYMQPRWSTDTYHHSNVWDFVFQSDGNLVLYDANHNPFWASNTNGQPATSLVLQDDGNLVLYGAGNHPIWATNTELPTGSDSSR